MLLTFFQLAFNMLAVLCMLHKQNLVHHRFGPEYLMTTLENPLVDGAETVGLHDFVGIVGPHHLWEP